MKSPFQMISDAFQPRYRVNFSIDKPDGSILLTLSDDNGAAVKRYIAPGQWKDREKLQRLIASLSATLAIEQDDTSAHAVQALRNARSSHSLQA
ncbi:DUF3509 domain-containing protein [Stutzerimonas urumqiensis]|uniref:DUF3509 domain-containing protein n=1 Tax=Stutzerimonas urumqiensis TaxID=638269 RepID=UPI000EB009EE|nr:DUF3509 domain-containing protein [Stutzerimonas urumqiensis]